MRAVKLAAMLLTVAAVALGGITAAADASLVVYKNTPFTLPKGFPSLGYECCQVAQFGGQVEFAGVARESPVVKVWLMSWACEQESPCKTRKGKAFRWPITLKIYEVGEGGEPGPLLAQITRTFRIPYRPTPNPECPMTPEGQGWGKECIFGVKDRISFSLPHAVLPNKAILAIAYNTESYGEEPTGKPGPEDSLNVAINLGEKCTKENAETKVCEEAEYEGQAPSTGTDPLPEQVYLDPEGSYALNTLACGQGTEGSFRLPGKCWPKEQPAFEVLAKYKY
jgi:hypothetical protein